jgi:hypothetical protein
MAFRPDMPDIPGAIAPATKKSSVIDDPTAQRRQARSPEALDEYNKLRKEREDAYKEQLAEAERQRIAALVGIRSSMDPAASYYDKDRTALEKLYGVEPTYGQARYGTI